jgi:hypothetical protein
MGHGRRNLEGGGFGMTQSFRSDAKGAGAKGKEGDKVN